MQPLCRIFFFLNSIVNPEVIFFFLFIPVYLLLLLRHSLFLLQKHNTATWGLFIHFSSLLLVLSSLSNMYFPPFCPPLDEKVELLTLFHFGSFHRDSWNRHISLSPRLSLCLSSVEKHPCLSLSLSSLSLSLTVYAPLSPSLSLSSRWSSLHSVSTAAALCLPPLSLFRQAVG